MKKASKFVTILLALTFAFALVGCSEGAPMKSGGMGTAIALGHNNCITEVTVIVDGYGQPVKVQFDDIFPVNNVYNNTALGYAAETKEISGKTYYEYLQIGNKYFKVNDSGIYTEIGAAGGTGISDLVAYCKTEEGVQWYYDSFIAGEMYICAVSDSGTEVGGVKLSNNNKKNIFNTANGSMRKRYSRYWSTSGGGNIGQVTGLGFNGNMDMLENYLLAYGFDALNNDGAITLPNKDNNRFNVIGGVTTGATLSADTAIYLKVAKAAYEKALASQTDKAQ